MIFIWDYYYHSRNDEDSFSMLDKEKLGGYRVPPSMEEISDVCATFQRCSLIDADASRGVA